MTRRFVNLIAQGRLRGGPKGTWPWALGKTGAYTLHRLDVAKHLFYPSTANASEENNGDGGDDPTPTRTERLRRLPAPVMRFERFPKVPRDVCHFALLNTRSSDGSKILNISSDGNAVLYDADSETISVMPSLDSPAGYKPITFTIEGSADDEKERLYLMTTHTFQLLDFNQRPPRKWQPLPLPPFYDEELAHANPKSFAVVDGGRAICMSFIRNGTYCFDTLNHEWSFVGDWELPFDGRVEYVPELDAWLGLSYYYPFDLCASTDLATAIDAHQEPTLRHVWQDFNPPPEEDDYLTYLSKINRRCPPTVPRRWNDWLSNDPREMVNLGAGRFCTAKGFSVQGLVSVGLEVEIDTPERVFAVLTGVEVLRGDSGEGSLWMVKHRSRCYKFINDAIERVL